LPKVIIPNDILSAGEYPIRLTSGYDHNYYFDLQNARLTVLKAPQTIDLTRIEKQYGHPPFKIDATTSADFQIKIVSNDNSVAIADGQTISITGAGHTELFAIHEGNNNYLPITQPIEFIVNKTILSVTPDSMTCVYGNECNQLTLNYDGFVYSDTIQSLSTKPMAFCEASQVRLSLNVAVYNF